MTFSASNYGVAGEWRFFLAGIGGATPDGQVTFTAVKPSTGVPGSGTVAVVVTPGTTVNATVRVMLNEGPTAQPWCPPGLSSVSKLGVVSAGKNLIQLDELTINPAGATIGDDGGSLDFPATTGINETFFREIYLPDGTYAFSVDGPPGTYARIGENAGNASPTIVFNSTGEYKKLYVRTPANDTPFTVKLMLELGPSATSYEPPAVTTTPIDLSGRQLRSLPNGTRDVLTVDGSGAVAMEQAVGCFSATTSTQWTQQAANLYYAVLGQRGVGSTYNIASDLLPSGEGANPWIGEMGVALGSDGLFVYARVPSAVSTAEQMRDFAAGHHFIYPLATPQTIHLSPITPPILRSPTFNVWAASDVPCDIEVDYDRDANIVINDLTARIAALEVANV